MYYDFDYYYVFISLRKFYKQRVVALGTTSVLIKITKTKQSERERERERERV